ncbi:MAG: hypothetical protein IPJ82_10385 [Lewinellaceae bacterium]|nr:hypothetical protein [Lewinellaceae bacterium]
MENNFFLTEDILWDYADDFLSAEDKIRVDSYLEQHPEWRERLEAIQAEKRAFSALPLEKPGPAFSDRVMAAWASEQAHARAASAATGKDRIIYLISAVFGMFILSALVMAGIQGAPAKLPVDLPQAPAVDWVEIFSNPVFHYGLYLILILLGLKVVDQYLHQRHMLDKMKMQG